MSTGGGTPINNIRSNGQQMQGNQVHVAQGGGTPVASAMSGGGTSIGGLQSGLMPQQQQQQPSQYQQAVSAGVIGGSLGNASEIGYELNNGKSMNGQGMPLLGGAQYTTGTPIVPGKSKKKIGGFLNDFKENITLDDLYMPIFVCIVYFVGSKRMMNRMVDEKLNTTMGMYIMLTVVGVIAYVFQTMFFGK